MSQIINQLINFQKFNPLFIVLFCIFCLTNCKSSSKRISKNALTQEQILKMNQAYAFVEEGEFLKGALIYDDLAKNLKEPSSKIMAPF